MKTVTVLGSTGSIGTQALEVVRWHGYRVAGLAAGRNADLLVAQAAEFRPKLVSCAPTIASQVARHLPPETHLVSGPEGSCEVARLPADRVLAAIPGMAGLEPTMAAVRAGRHVALANKESMVVAGPLLWQAVAEAQADLTPVDSEHSGLHQSLNGESLDDVTAMVLTASGGPFLEGPEDLGTVTPAEALRHPNWSMGPKVTIDSATLFNKGLEVLETHYLFGIPLEKIEVVIHPQSLIHALIRFRDGSIKAQIGPHDMRLPIQYGLTGPERPQVPLANLPLTGRWDLLEPDRARFPSLGLAYRAGTIGGVAPAALNAADEIAVEAFLAGRIRFTDIPKVLEEVLDRTPASPLTWSAITDTDAEARQQARRIIADLARVGG